MSDVIEQMLKNYHVENIYDRENPCSYLPCMEKPY